MKQEDKWMKKIHERLDDYSEPVPETLWQEIERDLLVDAPKIVPFWKRWQMAAAVALLLVVSSLSLWFWNSPGTTQYVENRSVQVAEETIPFLEILSEEVVSVAESQNEAKPLMALSGKTKDNKVVDAVDEYIVWESITVDEERTDTLETVEESPKEEKLVENKRTCSSNEFVRTEYPVSNKKHRSSWTFGVVGNLMAYTKGNERVYKMDSFLEPGRPENPIPGGDYGADGDSEPQDSIADDCAMIGGKDILRSRGESVPMLGADNYKHHAPVTVGLTVRWNMDDDWALESGLTYTILASDINTGHYKGEQKLHYIGVPLKVNRRIWNNRWLDVYGSAGGILEKCVYGKQVLGQYYSGGDYEKHQQKLEVNELQTSLNASLGVQLKLNKTIGVYAEPGVTYYFDDGSDVETIRKEHPFNFNLQVGVRFTFHK